MCMNFSLVPVDFELMVIAFCEEVNNTGPIYKLWHVYLTST